MPERGVIETRTSTVIMGADGIVRNTVNGQAIDRPDIEEWQAAYVRLSGGHKVRVLLDIHLFTSVTVEARRFAASQDHADVLTAAAILVGNPVGRVAGNFWIRINKPLFRARLFTDAEDAVAWLRSAGD